MISLIWILLLVCLCLSCVFVYIFIQSRRQFQSTETQRIKYSIAPSIDLIARRLTIAHARRESSDEEKLTQVRSHNLAPNLFVHKYTHRRQSAIIDSKQMANIEFAVPLTPDKFRRRSVAICNNIIESNANTIDSLIKTMKSSNQFLPCLISFAVVYLKSSQIQIQFHSLTSLPFNIQQLVIKIKLIPDGKVKNVEIKSIAWNENVFAGDKNEKCVLFSNIPSTKLHEKAIVMKFYGKDPMKKSVPLGQIGKIYFNQLQAMQNENPVEFTHEIELIKPSSMEIFVALEQTAEHHLTVDIQRIKGMKIDQKYSNGTGFFQVILLDRHRPLSTQQTKSFRLNSSTVSFQEPLQFNILAFNADNLDRIIIVIKFFCNTNQFNQHRCTARVKLASYVCTAGTGAAHWQQFQERKSFSMWHHLIKQS